MNREYTKWELESFVDLVFSVFKKDVANTVDLYVREQLLERSRNIVAALNDSEITLLEAYKAVYNALTPNEIHYGIENETKRRIISSKVIAAFLVKVDKEDEKEDSWNWHI